MSTQHSLCDRTADTAAARAPQTLLSMIDDLHLNPTRKHLVERARD